MTKNPSIPAKTDIMRIVRKLVRTGTHRRKGGQTPSIYTKPREAGQSWTIGA